MDSENGSAGLSGEQELHESLLRQNAILNNIPDIAWLKDRESRFIAVNGPFGKACGVAPPDLVGKTDYDIWPRDLAEGYRADDAEVMRTGQRKRVEERLIGPDGRESWIETIKTPILDAQGEVIGTTGIARDITDRKKAEEALYLKNCVFDVSIAANSMADTDGVITEANQAFLAIWGYSSKDEVIGKKIPEFLQNADEAAAIITALNDTGKWEGTYTARKKDASTFTAFGLATILRDEQGTMIGYQSSALDVTDRKRAEEALQESEHRYRTLFETMAQGVVYQASDGRIISANPASERILGLTLDQMQGRTSLDPRWRAIRVDGSDFPGDQHPAMEALRTGKPANGVIMGVFHPGLDEYRWILIDAVPEFMPGDSKPYQVYTTFTDITEHKQMEEALKESEVKFRSFFDTASDGILLVDPRTKGFSIGNAAMARMLGVGHDDLPRMKVEDIHPPERLQEVFQAFEKVARGEALYTENIPVLRKDGSIFFADIATSWITLKGVSYMAGFFRDTTERKKAEQERLDLERRLLHSQKLESLGILAGGIAHDFNNLLMAILGNLDLALRNLSPLSPARVNIEQSAQAARRATDLTRQMLAYSGKGRFMVKAMDLSEMVEENAHLLRASVARTATLDLHLDRSLPAIEADSGQIQQVIMNLIINASEAIGECAGRITVTTGVQQCDETCLKRSRIEDVPPAGPFVYLEVSDTGCGMDEPTQQRLFDPFFSTKAVGRGLGMPAVLGIVRGHHGAIFVDSTPGRGTTIRILFPVIEGAGTSKAAVDISRGTPAEAPALGGTVLVVDDEEIVRNVCTAMVRAFGMQVLTASDGREAVEVFRQNADRISHVILDLTMPNMDGMTAFKEIVRIRPDVNVILSSGYNEQDSVQRLSVRGRAGFIQKPYTLAKLREALEKAGGAAG